MKKIGAIIIIIAILLALYFGLWIMFIGGIMTIAKAWDTSTLSAAIIAWNVIKILLAGPVGVIIVVIGSLIGSTLMEG